MSSHLFQSLVLATGLLAGGVTAGAAADPLAGTHWRSRVVLVLADQANDPRLKQQRAIISQMGSAARERDIKLVEVMGMTPDALALRKRFDVPPTGFKALLIGKDGGSKLTSDEPLQAGVLVPTIDAMPMRREEMGRGSS